MPRNKEKEAKLEFNSLSSAMESATARRHNALVRMKESIENSKRLQASIDQKRIRNKELKAFNEYWDNLQKGKESEIVEKLKKTVERKTGNILKGRSDLKKKGDKYTVDTEMKIKKGLDTKTKRALIKSIIDELNTNFDEYEFFYNEKN